MWEQHPFCMQTTGTGVCCLPVFTGASFQDCVELAAAAIAAVAAAVIAVVVEAAEIPAATAAQKDENDDDNPGTTSVTH